MATAKVGKTWHFIRPGDKFELEDLGIFRDEDEAKAACPSGCRLLSRDEVREMATGRLVFTDIPPTQRFSIALQSARSVELKAEALKWEAALDLLEGRAERTGSLDSSMATDFEARVLAEEFLRSLADSLARDLPLEKLSAMGTRFATSKGCSAAESAKIGRLVGRLAEERRG